MCVKFSRQSSQESLISWCLIRGQEDVNKPLEQLGKCSRQTYREEKTPDVLKEPEVRVAGASRLVDETGDMSKAWTM